MPTHTCLCGRYECPDDHTLGARRCSTCGDPMSANPTVALGPDDKRSYYRCADGTVYLTREDAQEQGPCRPITLTPRGFWELPEA